MNNTESKLDTQPKARSAAAELSTAANPAAELAHLRSEIRMKQAKEHLNGLVSTGKVAFAARDLALGLLLAPDTLTVRFGDDEEASFSEAFKRFLDAQPPVILFSETAPAERASPNQFTAEDKRVFKALGVSEMDVQRLSSKKEVA